VAINHSINAQSSQPYLTYHKHPKYHSQPPEIILYSNQQRIRSHYNIEPRQCNRNWYQSEYIKWTCVTLCFIQKDYPL